MDIKLKEFNQWVKKHKDTLMLLTQIALVFCGILSVWLIFILSSTQNQISQNTLNETMRMDSISTRAYISLESPVLEAKVNSPIQFTLIIKNVGKSPALNLWECAFTESDSSKLKSKMLHAIDVANNHRNEGITLVPESSYPRVFHFIGYNLTLSDSLNTFAKNKFFIIGRINYTDIFNVYHFISFCYFYDSFTNRFLLYDKYNNAN